MKQKSRQRYAKRTFTTYEEAQHAKVEMELQGNADKVKIIHRGSRRRTTSFDVVSYGPLPEISDD